MSDGLVLMDVNSLNRDDYKKFLEKRITDIESFALGISQYISNETIDISISKILSDKVKTSLDLLSKFYLEYSFASEGSDSMIYGYRSVFLNPDIHAMNEFNLITNAIGAGIDTESKETLSGTIQFYRIVRSPGTTNFLESFLQEIKNDFKLKGENALDSQEFIYDLMQKGQIVDQYLYAHELRKLSDDEIEDELANIYSGKDSLSVGGFLREMIIDEENNRRDKERWAKGIQLPKVSFQRVEEIYSKKYPQHVIILPEALGGISLSEIRRYGRIDEVCENICTEISKRLPRKLDAYRFKQDYAEEVINIKGLGDLSVSIINHNNDVFTYINSINSAYFKIWNCRKSGRKYLKNSYDMSFPSNIKIPSKNIDIHLYDDGSGDTLSNEQINEISGWLEKNVLKKILATPENNGQEKTLPVAKKYPDSIGPLYAWIHSNNIEKFEMTRGDPKKVYPHERFIINPGRRLVSLGIKGDFPKEAYNGFVWCGIGKAEPDSNPNNYVIPGHFMDYEFNNNLNKLIQITPLDAEEIYISDYGVWDEVIELGFKKNLKNLVKDNLRLGNKKIDEFTERLYEIICGDTTDPKYDANIFGKDRSKLANKLGKSLRLTSVQLHDAYVALANTLMPIDKYSGGYKKPVVLISRPVLFEEVTIVPGVIYGKK